MRKHFYTIVISTLLFGCGFVSYLYAITAEPNVNFYGCDNGSQIESTTQIDTDGDGKYDTYVVKWCDGTIKTHQVQYGFKGVDIDNLEDEMGPRPYEKPLKKDKKRPKIVYANPTNSFKEVVYDIETGTVDFWWELNEGDETVYLKLPELNPRISISGDNQMNSNISLLPNPNSNEIKVNFELTESRRVTVNVYNQNGENLMTLHDGESTAGNHELSMNTSAFANGLYYIQSRIGSSVYTQKILLTK